MSLGDRSYMPTFEHTEESCRQANIDEVVANKINATEAHKNTIERIERIYRKDIEAVYTEIGKAIENGDTETRIECELPTNVILYLKEKGYQIFYQKENGKTFNRICW